MELAELFEEISPNIVSHHRNPFQFSRMSTPSEEPTLSPQEEKQRQLEVEREQEKKLKAKFPQRPPVPGGGGGGHSAFLQKRLAKGQKYFDSGDYQMAMQKGQGGKGLSGRMNRPGLVLANQATGDTIPTPEIVPARKSSIIQPINDHSQSMHVPADPAHVTPAPGHPMPNPAVTKLASWAMFVVFKWDWLHTPHKDSLWYMDNWRNRQEIHASFFMKINGKNFGKTFISPLPLPGPY